jgi:DNA adenine methylase
MAYLGGKATSAIHILSILNNPVFDNFDYIEPFCGYCHILRRVENKSSYTISDNNEYLITLLKHIQKTKGEHPVISKSEYEELKKNPKKNKLRAAYAAFTYSFNGKFFGSYFAKSKNGSRFYAKERKHYYDKLHDNESFHKAKISFTDYSKYKDVEGKLIYCDPPYEGTAEYHSEFDSAKFWEFVRDLSKKNYVFVSEYKAPDDFVCVQQQKKRQTVSGGRGVTRKKQEKVFVHESKLSDTRVKRIFKDVPSKSRCSLTRKNKN